jgi:hypothetical protein
MVSTTVIFVVGLVVTSLVAAYIAIIVKLASNSDR